MNSQHKVLCTHCGKLIPEAESDAHCATHEKTPIPAVASAESIALGAPAWPGWPHTPPPKHWKNVRVPLEKILREVLAYVPKTAMYDCVFTVHTIVEMALKTNEGADQRAQADALDARRYRYLRDFPPRARARKDAVPTPSLNDMWVSAFLNPAQGTIPEMDILEGAELDARIDAALRTSSPDPVVPRGEDVNYCCHACWQEIRPSPILDRMILCDVCGNKRCPKANDHRNACTNSNEPGQKGSAYA